MNFLFDSLLFTTEKSNEFLKQENSDSDSKFNSNFNSTSVLKNSTNSTNFGVDEFSSLSNFLNYTEFNINSTLHDSSALSLNSVNNLKHNKEVSFKMNMTLLKPEMEYYSKVNEENKEFLYLLIILEVIIFSTIYYMTKQKKPKNKKTINVIFKEEIKACFIIRGISLAYSIISKNTYTGDFKSYVNLALFHLSTLYFQIFLLDYIFFIIRKYYLQYYKFQKDDENMTKLFNYFRVSYCLLFFIIVVSYLFTNNRKNLEIDFLLFILNGITDIIISVLFLYYGISYGRIYEEKEKTKKPEKNERQEKQIASNHPKKNLIKQFNNQVSLQSSSKRKQIQSQPSFNLNKHYLNSDNFNDNLNLNINYNEENSWILPENESSTNNQYFLINEKEREVDRVDRMDKVVEEKISFKNQIIFVSISIFIIQLLQGLVYVIIGIYFFKDNSFKLINANLFDFMTILLGNYITALILIKFKLTSTFIPKKIKYKEDKKQGVEDSEKTNELMKSEISSSVKYDFTHDYNYNKGSNSKENSRKKTLKTNKTNRSYKLKYIDLDVDENDDISNNTLNTLEAEEEEKRRKKIEYEEDCNFISNLHEPFFPLN